MKKPKIGIVGGLLHYPRFFNVFEQLLPENQIDLFVIECTKFLSHYRSCIPVHVFENLKDMPGYMRGLEEYIADMDMLIGAESSRLSTFQMVRIAEKHKIPSAVLVNEFHPFFYREYPNIRAIQADIFDNSSRLWPSSRLAASMLKVEGVDDESICTVPPSVNIERFAPNPSLRQRFRQHIGMKPDDIIILANRELEPWTYSDELMMGFRLLRVTNPQFAQRLRLMFVGDGSQERELKYRCFDLQLGSSVVFIHQDSQPFARDLFAAADFVFCPRKQREEFHEDFPFLDLEAAASGCIPIYKRGSLLAEVCGGSGIGLEDVNFQCIADGLERVLTQIGGIQRLRTQTLEVVRANLSPGNAAEILQNEMATLLDSSKKTRQRASHLRDKVKRVLREGSLKEIDMVLEEYGLYDRDRASLYAGKGRIQTDKGQLEDAFETYQEAIRLDDNLVDGYIGLGNLSLKSHSHEEAISFFKKALSIDDKVVEAMVGVGMVHRRLGLNEEAIFWFERCMSIEPENQRVLTALAQACLDCQSNKVGISALERIKEMRHDEPTLLLTLGQLYLRSGKAELGNKLVSEALLLQQGSR